MKTTSDLCFGHSLATCGMALDAWQDNNCRRCAKARFLNADTGRKPKYYCAIQAQIETQAETGEPVNVRTYNAVHGLPECVFIKRSEREPTTPVIDAHEFAKGEIVEQAVPDKRTETKQAEPPTQSLPVTSTIPDRETRLKEIAEQIKRDNNPVLPNPDDARFREQIKEDVDELMRAFTWEEHKYIAYVPIVMNIVAFRYAFMAKQYAADNRIPELKIMSRAITALYKEFVESLRKDLDATHIQRVMDATDDWMNDTANDQMILQVQVANAYLNQFTPIKHQQLFVYATCCRLIAQLVLDFQRDIDAMINKRLGRELYPTPWPFMPRITHLMDGIIQDKDIVPTETIKCCIAVMRNRMVKIKWIEKPGK